MGLASCWKKRLELANPCDLNCFRCRLRSEISPLSTCKAYGRKIVGGHDVRWEWAVIVGMSVCQFNIRFCCHGVCYVHCWGRASCFTARNISIFPDVLWDAALLPNPTLYPIIQLHHKGVCTINLSYLNSFYFLLPSDVSTIDIVHTNIHKHVSVLVRINSIQPFLWSEAYYPLRLVLYGLPNARG